MSSLGSVSGVSFRAQNIDLDRRGAFDNQDLPTKNLPKEEKPSSGAEKKVIGTIATLAIIAGALWAAPKYLPDIFKANKDLTNSKGFNKILDYATSYTAKAGELIDKYAKAIYEKVAGYFSKK